MISLIDPVTLVHLAPLVLAFLFLSLVIFALLYGSVRASCRVCAGAMSACATSSMRSIG